MNHYLAEIERLAKILGWSDEKLFGIREWFIREYSKRPPNMAFGFAEKVVKSYKNQVKKLEEQKANQLTQPEEVELQQAVQEDPEAELSPEEIFREFK